MFPNKKTEIEMAGTRIQPTKRFGYPREDCRAAISGPRHSEESGGNYFGRKSHHLLNASWHHRLRSSPWREEVNLIIYGNVWICLVDLVKIV
jgi:hypothetical protein